jgi:hypothetical protein
MGPSSISVIGDNLLFLVTSEIVVVSLFSVVIPRCKVTVEATKLMGLLGTAGRTVPHTGPALIRLKHIYNFLCSMLIYTPFALCFVTLRGVFMHFPELTY